MRQTLLTVIVFISAAALSAQTGSSINTINTNRSGGPASSGVFTIGGRLSNYSTNVREASTPIKTGRQNSFGAVGAYRNGPFVLDFNYDHDPENGLSIVSLIVDTGNYSRDHSEVTAGYSPAPFLDLQGGLRFDTSRIGGVSVFGNRVATDLNIDHQALTGGIRLHTDTAPLGFFVAGRGFIGSAKVDLGFGKNDSDTSGYRGEAGLNIRLGESAWSVQPGYEYDHFETKDLGIRMNTNRLFLNFVYRTGM